MKASRGEIKQRHYMNTRRPAGQSSLASDSRCLPGNKNDLLFRFLDCRPVQGAACGHYRFVCGPVLPKTSYSKGFSAVATFFEKGVSFVSSHPENVGEPSEKVLAFTLFPTASKYKERTGLRFERSLS